MIVRKDDGVFTQSTPSSVWAFNVPAGHKFPHVIGSFSDDGKTEYNMDNVEIVDGVITISFGIDQHVGVLKYSYETESGTTEITGDGGVINVTINQNNSGTSSQP